MALVRWSPMRDMARLQDQMDRLFGPAGTTLAEWPWATEGFAPVVDISETSDAYLLRADLPGVRIEDVKVQLVNNVLTIRGERKRSQKEETANFIHTERVHGSFERSFTLGNAIQPDSVTARYADGVLEIRVQKSETQKLKEITIQR